MINAWRHSGNGNTMLEEDEDEVYRFIDGDDRQAFLKFTNNKIYALCFWDLA
jgi:hypothetical protein